MYEASEGFFSFLVFRVWPFSAWVRTVSEGAAAQVMAAVDPVYGDPERGGAYICNDMAYYRPKEPWSKTHDPAVMRRVWEMSEKAITDLGYSLFLEE